MWTADASRVGIFASSASSSFSLSADIVTVSDIYPQPADPFDPHFLCGLLAAAPFLQGARVHHREASMGSRAIVLSKYSLYICGYVLVMEDPVSFMSCGRYQMNPFNGIV
jgi:hypothetical protein